MIQHWPGYFERTKAKWPNTVNKPALNMPTGYREAALAVFNEVTFMILWVCESGFLDCQRRVRPQFPLSDFGPMAGSGDPK